MAEDQIGSTAATRRDVQRRLTKLGFDVHVNGKFDDETRNVIKRWQAVRGYPSTGFLNKAQHTALLSENLGEPRARRRDSPRPRRRTTIIRPRACVAIIAAAAAAGIIAAAVAAPARSSAA